MGASQARKPKSTQNLARHRNKKGRRPKAHLSDVELRFCAMRARGVPIRQAALELGFKEGTVLQWGTRRPAIQKQIDEYAAQQKDEAYKDTAKEIELRNEFLDQALIDRVRRDRDATRLIEIGYKRTGAIRTHSIKLAPNVPENPNEPPPTGLNFYEVYESKWLTRRKTEWTKQLEEKHGKPRAK